MDTQPRVITTYAWFRPTGAARRLRRAVLALANAGIPVDYVAVQPPELNHPRVTVHLIRPPRLFASSDPGKRSPGFWLWYAIAGSVKCARLAARAPGARLMGFTFSAAFTLLPARMFTRRPLVVFVRSDELLENVIKQVAWPLRMAFRMFVALLGRCATRFVTVHRQLGNRLVEALGERVRNKIVLLPNDLPAITPDRSKYRVELLRITRRTEPVFLVASTARFERRKNARLLLDALKDVPAPAHLVLIGGGPEGPALEQQAASLGIRDRVTFAGWRDDAADLVSAADLYVQPSLAEGMSNSVLEALAAGLPCIVSDIPVHRDVIEEAELRFPTDNPREVARLVTRMMQDDSFRNKAADACRKTADRYRFDWDTEVVRKIMD